MVCPSWLSFILYNPLRKRFTDRAAVLRRACVGKDSVVLEVGAGNGFFTEVLATHARTVHAVDVQEGMARKLSRRLGSSAGNVKIVQGDVASLDMEEGFADVVFLYYSFHEVAQQEAAARAMVRSLKAGGVVALFEPTVEVGRGAMDQAIGIFGRLGMQVEDRRDELFTRYARLRKQGGVRASSDQGGCA